VVIERVFFLCARAELPVSLKTGRQLLNNFPALRFESPFGDIITENLFELPTFALSHFAKCDYIVEAQRFTVDN